MAYAISTFGNGNTNPGLASRRKKAASIVTPGTLLTGVAVVAFAWVTATLITTQSMVLSLPRATMSADNSFTPGATAFIVPQKFPAHAVRTKARGLPAEKHAYAVPADAPMHGLYELPATDMAPPAHAASTPTVRMPQLASALTQQASDLAQARAVTSFPTSSVAKSGRMTAEGSPEAVAHLRKVLALGFASAAQSLLQGKYAASPMPTGSAAAALSTPSETAILLPGDRQPTPVEAAPPPARASDLPPVETPQVAEVIPSVLPMARPEHVAARAPVTVADDVDKNDDSDEGTSAPPSRLLAYAKPEENKPRRSLFNPFAAFDGDSRGGTAIYDISAKTVYLPGGERLEAHSGLGYMQDNPRYVNQKNRGPTPPHTYDLTLRESLFHGVQALRLTPSDGGGVFGRDGLLAHTYMLGPRGASNGCVSFKNYRRFLAAYRRGEIKRLVVVAHLAGSPENVASR
jgi:hypothetical protein